MIQDVLAAGSHLQLLELLNLCSHYLIQVCGLACCCYTLHNPFSCRDEQSVPIEAQCQVKGRDGGWPVVVEFLEQALWQCLGPVMEVDISCTLLAHQKGSWCEAMLSCLGNNLKCKSS